MTSWHSYPSIYALGHKAVEDLFDGEVTIQEKVDGSQFSFGVFDGELRCRSKGAQLNLIAPEGMFIRAIESVQHRLPALHDGWTYRGEYLQKPKHNALAYDRTPEGHIILFDINVGHEEYLPFEEMAAEAERIGLESVPLIHRGEVNDLAVFRSFLERTSVLGGQKVEGVVVKNYARFGQDKKVLMGKFVSEAFKEVHAKEWKESNPKQGDVVQRMIEMYRTPARWQKAVQHLTEAGKAEGSPRDIGHLIKEVAEDVERECRDEIAQALYQWAWPQVRRGIVAGLPEWYKDELLKSQFATEETQTA